MKRRRVAFDAIRKKARQNPSLDLQGFRLVVRELFCGFQYDEEKQFVSRNGFITAAMAKKRSVQGEGSARARAELFQ